jgi:hypothetical protein
MNKLSRALALAALLAPGTARAQVEHTITVDFSSSQSAPTYGASGFIYGLSADGTEPPQRFVSDIKTRMLRVGGSRLECPNGGWVNGSYDVRWQSVLAYYRVAQAAGARLVLLVSDLWGADLACTLNELPGDAGDWTRYTSFLARIIEDAGAAGLTGPDFIWDLWNEPDCCGFWADRSQSQYLDMWTRGYQQLRAALPEAVISGPSTAGGPGSAWFIAFVDSIAATGAVPDYVSWHANPGDPVPAKMTAESLLAARGLSVRGYHINEYGQTNEQSAGWSGWYIGRLERAGIEAAARSNWAGGVFSCPGGVCAAARSGLWSTMGALVQTAPDGYQPLPAWWIYKRYGDMTGLHVATSSTSTAFEALAATDVSATKAVVVLGTLNATATLHVNLTQLDSAPHLVADGRVHIVLERFPDSGQTLLGPAIAAQGDYEVVAGQASIDVAWNVPTDGYALILTRPSSSVGEPAAAGDAGTSDLPGDARSKSDGGCSCELPASSTGLRRAATFGLFVLSVGAARARRRAVQ